MSADKGAVTNFRKPFWGGRKEAGPIGACRSAAAEFRGCAPSCFSRVGLCNPMDWNPPGSSVCGIIQACILEWVTVPSPRGYSQSRVEPMLLMSHALVSEFFTISTIWEALLGSCGQGQSLVSWKKDAQLRKPYRIIVVMLNIPSVGWSVIVSHPFSVNYLI